MAYGGTLGGTLAQHYSTILIMCVLLFVAYGCWRGCPSEEEPSPGGYAVPIPAAMDLDTSHLASWVEVSHHTLLFFLPCAIQPNLPVPRSFSFEIRLIRFPPHARLVLGLAPRSESTDPSQGKPTSCRLTLQCSPWTPSRSKLLRGSGPALSSKQGTCSCAT